MLAKRVIPCLDVHHGRVVKGVQFVSLSDAGDPAESARRYAAEGADEITFLDISASHEERSLFLPVLHQVAESVFIPLTVGGGVHSVADVQVLLDAGADKVSVNTAAVLQPQLINDIAAAFGSQCLVVALDVRQRSDGNGWEVVTHGGRRPSGRDALAWAQEAAERGAGELLLTSMDRDGTGQGFDISLTRTISRAVNIPVIASGGAGSVADMIEGILDAEADAVLAASIFHYGQVRIPELKQAMHEAAIPVRL